MTTTVDSFIKIFKFYQDNPIVKNFYYNKDAPGIYDKNGKSIDIDPKTKKPKKITLSEIFRFNKLRYQDTVDVYLNSLVLDKYTQLSCDSDEDINLISTALQSRESMKKYITHVFYPGSYAFNTADNASMRRMILDWTSTIKTLQDSNKKLTDAYSLNSEDIDKALRGFGTDFINQTSLLSLNKRKNFLLNLCDLYSIKGTPQSIVKALNLIGINNIFIREGWMFYDEDKADVCINWQAIKEKSTFNSTTNQYEDLKIRDDMISGWNWFETKIHSEYNRDPHWMYTKEDIESINNSKDTWIKLPSITPYFGIEFITNADRQQDTYETLFRLMNKEFQKYISGNESLSDFRIQLNEYDKKLSILQAYTCLVYTLIRLDDHLQYENFRSFLISSEIKDIPTFSGKYEYFNLIYWFYKKYFSKSQIEDTSYNVIQNYIPIKSNNYCSYEQLLTWWLESDYSEEEKDLIDVMYIQPGSTNNSSTHIQLVWEAPFEFGRYGVEAFSESRVTEEDKQRGKTDSGWLEILHGGYSYQKDMTCVVPIDNADGFGENINNFRIVYYHTYSNLPSIFFNTPFNLDRTPQDTFLDRVVRYNGPSLGLDYYKNTELGEIFKNHSINSKSADFDVISGYHETEALSTHTRFTDIDTTLKSFYCSAMKYPNLTRLYEDKWMNTNNDFYNFVDWSIKDFYDTQKHIGLLQNERNLGKNGDGTLRKYPVNSKWNWAIDDQYLYYCYESNKWCRLRISGISNINDINSELVNSLQNAALTYGGRFYDETNKCLYVYVAHNTYAYIDETVHNISTDWGNNEDVLSKISVLHGSEKYEYVCKIKSDSKLSRDMAVGQIKDSYILELIAKDFSTSNATTVSEKEERAKLLKILNSEIIEVYKDPYNRVEGDSYNYEGFLTYLYNSRLNLDLSSGYIYPNYKELISKDKIYLSTINSSGKTTWIQINPQFSWDGAYIIVDDEKQYAKSIYEDGSDGTNLGFLYPPYTFQNRYDSLRFLDGPVYDTVEDLEKADNNDEIDESINYVLIRKESSLPVVYKRVINMNDSGTGTDYSWEECTDNRIYNCNYGIGPDVLEFIESRYAQNDQYYVHMVNDFTETINDYISDTLGIDNIILDLSIANYSTTGIVKKVINYYKPKRARMLFLSNIIEGEYGTNNNLDTLNIGDNDFNYYDLASYRYGVPNKRDLNKMNRTKISVSVNDYTPLDDTIFKKSDDSGEIYTIRELFVDDSKIPELEVFDDVLNMNQQVFKGVSATFYVQDLEVKVDNEVINILANGFYFKIIDDDGSIIYTNNYFVFKQVSCMFRDTDDSIKSETRWAIFTVKDTEFNHATCTYIAQKATRDPFIDVSNKLDSKVKYALRNIKAYPKFVNDLDYKYGTFYTDNIIKTNKRTLEPLLYISGFDQPECNGFYYQDSTLKPDRNNKPVYFNQHGKIISYTKPSWFVDSEIDSDDNRYIYDKDDEGNYINNKTFWIITDDKEIIEFKDAFYFVICDDKDTSLFNTSNGNVTKVFHKSINKNEDKTTWGIDRDTIYTHSELINDVSGFKKPVYDKYTPYTRNQFNAVVLKNQPAMYLYTNNKKVTSITYIDDDSKTAKINVNLNNTDFAIDKEGNTYGAVKVNGDNSGLEYDIEYQNTPEWTISFRILFETQEDIEKIFRVDISTSEGNSSVIYVPSSVKPNTWLMFTLTSEGNYYINDTLEDINLNSYYFDFSISNRKLSINNINCKVSEFGFWNYVLNDWYIGVISKFRILRCRPEPQKSKTSHSPNNYRPLFAIDSPRTIYPLGQTSLPENVIGDRLNGYNADTRYNSNTHKSEVNPLWKLDRDNNLYVKGGAYTESYRLFEKPFKVNDGVEYQSNSNYRGDPDNLPFWWIGKSSDYKTGPISHKPVYIATKITVNEKYPHIRKGNECKPGNYMDIGLYFDGVNNVDSSEYNGESIVYVRNDSKWYYDITFDPYSSYTLEYNKYVFYYDYFYNTIGYTNNQIWDENHNAGWKQDEYSIVWKTSLISDVMIEEVNNYYPTKYIPACTIPLRYIKISNIGGTFNKNITDDSIIVLDTAQLILNDFYKENGIFHDKLYYRCNSEAFSVTIDNENINGVDLSGEWEKSSNVKSFRDGDFNCCYRHRCIHNHNLEAVLTYQRNCGYFWWEIRIYINNEWKTIARTFVSSRSNVSRRLKWKDFVNWNQIDLCGQALCEFKETDYDDFKNKSWGTINQNIISKSRFICGKIIKIVTEEVSPSVTDYVIENLHYNDSDLRYKNTVFSRNNYLYFFDTNKSKWYKSTDVCVDVDWNTEFPNSDQLDEYPSSPSGFIYRNNYLYFYDIINKKWIKLPVNEVSASLYTEYYQPWKYYSYDGYGLMNVIDSSDSEICDCFENCFVIPGAINIIETYEKFIRFNDKPEYDWSKHINDEFDYLKSVNNNISICRCSVKDSLYIYLYTFDQHGDKQLITTYNYNDDIESVDVINQELEVSN